MKEGKPGIHVLELDPWLLLNFNLKLKSFVVVVVVISLSACLIVAFLSLFAEFLNCVLVEPILLIVYSYSDV
jgi:hypothetical protein